MGEEAVRLFENLIERIQWLEEEQERLWEVCRVQNDLLNNYGTRLRYLEDFTFGGAHE